MSDRDLIAKLLTASETINESLRKGNGNYILTSPTVSQWIKKINREEVRKEKITKIFEKV